VAKAVARKHPSAKSAALPVEVRIARLLGLLLIRDVKEKGEQVLLLKAAGFEVSEIADMLGISANHVSVVAYASRRKKKA
jgi:hypothetical protein